MSFYRRSLNLAQIYFPTIDTFTLGMSQLFTKYHLLFIQLFVQTPPVLSNAHPIIQLTCLP